MLFTNIIRAVAVCTGSQGVKGCWQFSPCLRGLPWRPWRLPHPHPLITFAEDKLFQSPQPNWSPRRAETFSINLSHRFTHSYLRPLHSETDLGAAFESEPIFRTWNDRDNNILYQCCIRNINSTSVFITSTVLIIIGNVPAFTGLILICFNSKSQDHLHPQALK